MVNFWICFCLVHNKPIVFNGTLNVHIQVSKPVTSRNKQEIRKIYNTGRTHKAYGVEINSKLFLKLLLKKDGSVMREDLVLSSIAEGNLKCGHAYQFWITFQTSTPKFYFLLLASSLLL